MPWRKDRAETRLCKDRSWYGVNDNERAGESREAFRTFEGLRTVSAAGSGVEVIKTFHP